jgi:hypothetical protein
VKATLAGAPLHRVVNHVLAHSVQAGDQEPLLDQDHIVIADRARIGALAVQRTGEARELRSHTRGGGVHQGAPEDGIDALGERLGG